MTTLDRHPAMQHQVDAFRLWGGIRALASLLTEAANSSDLNARKEDFCAADQLAESLEEQSKALAEVLLDYSVSSEFRAMREAK